MSTQSPTMNATEYARSLGITQAMVKATVKPGGMFVFTGLEPDDGVCSLAECEPDGYRVLPPSRGVDANWHVTDHGETKVAHCYGFGHDVAQGEQFARRIAACLNLLVGVPTDQIERWARPDANPPA